MNGRRAFTLVELLVVIAIIAILTAILVPMAGRARDQARATACASNMKQIYAALLAYATDNQDGLPFTAAYQDTTNPMVSPYIYRMQGVGVIDYTQGVVWPYVGQNTTTRMSIFNCPSDLGEAPNGFQNVVRNFSYSFNEGLNWDIVQQTPVSALNSNCRTVRITNIPAAAHKILIWEEVGPNDGWCACLNNDPQDYPTQRHMIHGKSVSNYNTSTSAAGGGRGNQCFADGHVECLDPLNIWNNPYWGDLHFDRSTDRPYPNMGH